MFFLELVNPERDTQPVWILDALPEWQSQDPFEQARAFMSGRENEGRKKGKAPFRPAASTAVRALTPMAELLTIRLLISATSIDRIFVSIKYIFQYPQNPLR